MTDKPIHAVHPRVLADKHPPPVVTVDGTDHPADSEGRFDVPVEKAEWLADLAAAYGVDLRAVRVGGPGVCETIQDDGDACGRDLPCQYHNEDES